MKRKIEPEETYTDPIDWADRVLVPLGLQSPSIGMRATIKAAYGTALSSEELEFYHRLSGNVDPPVGGSKRILLVFGRRGGKSSTMGLVLAYTCIVEEHYKHLAPGQIGIAAVVAQDLDGAQHVIDYAKGIAEIPSIKREHVKSIIEETITFTNGTAITKITASEKAVRGHTLIACVGDEIASWDKIGPNPDKKVMSALTPGLLVGSNAPTRRFFGITSAGYQDGWAFDTYGKNFGKRSAHWMVLRGSTLDLRPDLTQADIDADCPDVHEQAREYGCEWGDLSASTYFVPADIKACVDLARTSAVPPEEGVRYYVALDPAFERDMFAISVVCSKLVLIPDDIDRKRRRVTECVLIEAWKPTPSEPLAPSVLAKRCAVICRRYGASCVYSDQHASAPLREHFAGLGIRLEKRAWHSNGSGVDDSGKKKRKPKPNKPERFGAVREAMADRSIILPNDADLIRELQLITGEPLPNSGGIKIKGKSKNDDRAHAFVLAASEALIGSPSISVKSMLPWEREERESRWENLVMAVTGPGPISFF